MEPSTRPEVTLQQLRCATAVADVGSVTWAASSLGLAQPSVSQQLARLEAALGSRLFRRRGRTMVLTPAGHQTVAMARDVLARVAEGVDRVRYVQGGIPSPLTVGILSSLATSVFPDAVVHWKERYPDRALRLREELRRMDLQAAVRAADIDVAVGAPPDGWSGVVVAAGDEELVLVVPPSRRAAFGKTTRLAALSKDPWVLYDPDHGLYGPTLRACGAAGFRPDEALRTRQVDTAVRMAARDVGVAVCPSGSVPPDVAHLMVRCRPRLHSPVAVWGLGGCEVDAERLAAVLRQAPWRLDTAGR
jgi:DNA-binding transcriptional LysR family regulator